MMVQANNGIKLVAIEMLEQFGKLNCRYVFVKSILILESTKQEAIYGLKDKLVPFGSPQQMWFRIGAKSGFCV